MQRKTNVWGTVIQSESFDEEKEDPIIMLIQKYEDLKKSLLVIKPNETIEQAQERRRQELYLIDKEIQDAIYRKRLRNM